MLIGNQYSDNKMYRGIRHYDSLPLMSEDIHEYTDTLATKNAYIMDSVIGQGVLSTPTINVSDAGVSLESPVAIIIHGDVSLIQTDDILASAEDIATVGINEGVICIVGWYQHLNASSTLRNYGGVKNSILENNLTDNPLDIQVSTRYQFRWLPVIIDSNSIESGSFEFTIYNRDEHGNVSTGSSTIRVREKLSNIFIADKPESMEYAIDDIYIIPLIKYEYISGNISSAKLFASLKASSELIAENGDPTGEYPSGTIWFNTITREFKIYVEGEGFVDNAATMALLQYQSVYTMQQSIVSPTDILVPIGIEEYTEGDILQVTYEGLLLTEGEHYTVQHAEKTITLLQFTASTGELVTFNITKVVKANDITNITALFTTHMSQTANSTDSSHVKLSDSTDSALNAKNGVAATPKAVSDSRILTDKTTNIKYKFGIDNGLVYLEEV